MEKSYWNQILPNDRYIIQRRTPFIPTHTGYLLHFYQPIIGCEAISFYLTLSYEIPLDQIGTSAYDTHRWLMAACLQPLDQIVRFRHLLESVGLLRTRRWQSSNEERCYEYTLHAPLDPISFFQSDILSILLLNRVGKFKYRELRSKYIASPPTNHEDFPSEEVTKRFDEVFTRLSPSELVVKPGSEMDQMLQEWEEVKPYFTYEEIVSDQAVKLQNRLDFDLLKAMLSPQIEPDQILTPEVCESIQEWAYFYQLNEMQLSHFLEDFTIYDASGELVLEKLNKSIKAWYKENHFGQPPDLKLSLSTATEQSNPEEKSKPQFANREEEHIHRLQTVPPLTLMEAYHDGAKIPDSDVDLVDSLLKEYRLPPGVVNVLIEYVMLTNQYRLPRALVEKIAGHWKRMRLTDVKAALSLAREEHRLYRQWSEGKPKGQASSSKGKRSNWNAGKNEKLPSSVMKQMEREKQLEHETPNGSEEDPYLSRDFKEKERRVLELLKALDKVD